MSEFTIEASNLTEDEVMMILNAESIINEVSFGDHYLEQEWYSE